MKDEIKKKLEKIKEAVAISTGDPKVLVEKFDDLKEKIEKIEKELEVEQIKNKVGGSISIPVTLKMDDLPREIDVKNFPEIQKVKVEKPEWYKEIKFPDVQKVEVVNQPVFPKFPEVQKVEVINKEKESAPRWLSEFVLMVFDKVVSFFSKLAKGVFVVKLAEGEREKPQFVVQIDPETGEPMGRQPIIVQTGGGGGSRGGTVEIAGTPYHYNGEVGTDASTITLAGKTKSVLIENMHETQNLYVSFDSGTNWKTIRPYGMYAGDIAITSFQVKGSDDNTTYECIVVI